MGHFKVAEFECKCKKTREAVPVKGAPQTNLSPCGAPHVNITLICALDRVREKFGEPIRVTSGVRCAAHNKRVGGAKSSQHLTGLAADITCRPERLKELLELCRKEPALTGIGNGIARGAAGGFVHVDVRAGTRVEWSYV